MIRWAVAYQVCTTCIKRDPDGNYSVSNFYKKLEEHLEKHGFTQRVKFAIFTCPEGESNTREDAENVAQDIFDMDKNCDYLTSLHVLQVGEFADLMVDHCGCEISDDIAHLEETLDRIKPNCDEPAMEPDDQI